MTTKTDNDQDEVEPEEELEEKLEEDSVEAYWCKMSPRLLMTWKVIWWFC